jgi:hypothetical protein
MFSCKIASRLISDSIDRPLSFWERFSLRFHLFICTFCRRFQRHTHFLQRLGGEELHMLDDVFSGEKLSPEARVRIERAMERQRDASE